MNEESKSKSVNINAPTAINKLSIPLVKISKKEDIYGVIETYATKTLAKEIIQKIKNDDEIDDQKYLHMHQNANINEFFKGIIVDATTVKEILKALKEDIGRVITSSRGRDFEVDSTDKTVRICFGNVKIKIAEARDEIVNFIFSPAFSQLLTYTFAEVQNGKVCINYKHYMEMRKLTDDKTAKRNLELFYQSIKKLSLLVQDGFGKRKKEMYLTFVQHAMYEEGVCHIHFSELFGKYFVERMKQCAYINKGLLTINHRQNSNAWYLGQYLYTQARIEKNELAGNIATDENGNKYRVFRRSAKNLFDNTTIEIPKEKKRLQQLAWEPLLKNLEAIKEATRGEIDISVSQYSAENERNPQTFSDYMFDIRILESEITKKLDTTSVKHLAKKEKAKLRKKKKGS